MPNVECLNWKKFKISKDNNNKNNNNNNHNNHVLGLMRDDFHQPLLAWVKGTNLHKRVQTASCLKIECPKS